MYDLLAGGVVVRPRAAPGVVVRHQHEPLRPLAGDGEDVVVAGRAPRQQAELLAPDGDDRRLARRRRRAFGEDAARELALQPGDELVGLALVGRVPGFAGPALTAQADGLQQLADAGLDALIGGEPALEQPTFDAASHGSGYLLAQPTRSLYRHAGRGRAPAPSP